MPEEYDFSKTAINEWSVPKTPKVVLAHLKFAAETMAWFQEERAQSLLLNDAYPLTREEYDLLLEKAFPLHRDFSTSASVHALFHKVVQRGIVGMRAFAPMMVDAGFPANEDAREAIRTWFNSLLYQLRRLSPQSVRGTYEEWLSLLDSLADIGVFLKAEWMLENVAQVRYPEDKLAQQLYVEHLKTWE